MDSIFYIFAMNAHDIWLLILVLACAYVFRLVVFWLFYGLCGLAAGLSMRLAYTFGLLYLLVGLFFVVRDLKEYFVWWHYTPGPRAAVMNDAILVWAFSALWLVLIWAIWPRPRRQLASL